MKMTLLAACETCAKMRGTNCCDVEITKSIMTGIVLIAAICAAAYIVVKFIDACFKACQERKKKEWEEKEADRKRDRELLDMKLKKLNDADYISEITRVLNEK